ncbi:hypothetical protein BHM03_00020468 [Ensete ventricosum]|nr:hypothetical protein BHM03_00020468 [Ensete ventricosum]
MRVSRMPRVHMSTSQVEMERLRKVASSNNVLLGLGRGRVVATVVKVASNKEGHSVDGGGGAHPVLLR